MRSIAHVIKDIEHQKAEYTVTTFQIGPDVSTNEDWIQEHTTHVSLKPKLSGKPVKIWQSCVVEGLIDVLSIAIRG